MPVLFDSSASTTKNFLGASNSVSASFDHTTTTLGADLCGVVAVQLEAGVNVSSSSITATWGGSAMTLVPNSRAVYKSGDNYVALFYLLNPPTGEREIVVTAASVPTQLGSRNIYVCSATYTGVASVTDAVSVIAAAMSTQVALTVDGVADAYRIVAAFGVDDLFFGDIKSSNADKRAQANTLNGGELWLVDTVGADDKVVSAQIANSNVWAAAGFVLNPSPVYAEAAPVSARFTTEARAGLKREQPPHRSRYWLVPPA